MQYIHCIYNVYTYEHVYLYLYIQFLQNVHASFLYNLLIFGNEIILK